MNKNRPPREASTITVKGTGKQEALEIFFKTIEGTFLIAMRGEMLPSEGDKFHTFWKFIIPLSKDPLEEEATE